MATRRATSNNNRGVTMATRRATSNNNRGVTMATRRATRSQRTSTGTTVGNYTTVGTKGGTDNAVEKPTTWEVIKKYVNNREDIKCYEAFERALKEHNYMSINFDRQGYNLGKEKVTIVSFECMGGVDNCEVSGCKQKSEVLLCYTAKTPRQLFRACSICMSSAYNGDRWKTQKTSLREGKTYNDFNDFKRQTCSIESNEDVRDILAVISLMDKTIKKVRKSSRRRKNNIGASLFEGRDDNTEMTYANASDNMDIDSSLNDDFNLLDPPDLVREEQVAALAGDLADVEISEAVGNNSAAAGNIMDSSDSNDSGGGDNTSGSVEGGGNNASVENSDENGDAVGNNSAEAGNMDSSDSNGSEGGDNTARSSGSGSVGEGGDNASTTKSVVGASVGVSNDNDVVVIVKTPSGDVTKTVKRSDSVTTLARTLAFDGTDFYYLTLDKPIGGGWLTIHPGTTFDEITQMTTDDNGKITATKRVVNWITDLPSDVSDEDEGVQLINTVQQKFDFFYKKAAYFTKKNYFLADNNKYALLRLYESVRVHALKCCHVEQLDEPLPSTLATYFSELADAISDYRDTIILTTGNRLSFGQGWIRLLEDFGNSLNTLGEQPQIKRSKTATAVPSNENAYQHHGSYECAGCGNKVTAVTSFQVKIGDSAVCECLRGLVRVNPADGTAKGNLRGKLPSDWLLHPQHEWCYMCTETTKFISKKSVNALESSFGSCQNYLLRLLLLPFHSFLQLYLRRYDNDKMVEVLPEKIFNNFGLSADSDDESRGGDSDDESRGGDSDDESGGGDYYNKRMHAMSNIFIIFQSLLKDYSSNFGGDAWANTVKNFLKHEIFDTSDIFDDNFDYKKNNENDFCNKLVKKLVNTGQIKKVLQTIFGEMSKAIRDDVNDRTKEDVQEKSDEDMKKDMKNFIAEHLMTLLYNQVKTMWTEDGKEVLDANVTVVAEADKFANEISTTIATMILGHAEEWVLMHNDANATE